MNGVMLRLLVVIAIVLVRSEAQIERANNVISEYEQSIEQWKVQMEIAESETVRQKLSEERPSDEMAARRLYHEIGGRLADQEVVPYIGWLFDTMPHFLQSGPELNEGEVVRDALLRYHYKTAGAGALCMKMYPYASVRDIEFMEKVATDAPLDADRGLANLALSLALQQIGDESEVRLRRLEVLKQAIIQVPAESTFEGRLCQDMIREQIFGIRYLSKGGTAPMFVSKLQTGVEWRLEHEGRSGMVALAFLGELQPSGQVLDGVLSDMADLLHQSGGELVLISTVTSEGRPYGVHLYDRDSQVTELYQVQDMPSIILLDESGTVQAKGEPGELINLAIRALAEAL